MKDLVLVGPILMVGGIFVVSTQSGNWHGSGSHFTLELAFLTFLFSLLFAWHRGKQAAAERLRAMELGWRQPEGAASSPISRSTVTTGIMMPLGLLGIAWLASSSRPDLSTPIWSAASLLGMTTLICGTILLLRQPSLLSSPSERRSEIRSGIVKANTDPDEFDVVSQRGSNGHPFEARF